MKKQEWRRDYKRRLQLAMLSAEYARLRQKYVVGKWQLREGCKSIEEFDQMIAEWWKEYDRTETGYLERELFEMDKEDLPPETEGAYPQDERGLSFVDYETCIVRCLKECEKAATCFGLARWILLRSLFLPEETIRSMDKLDPSEFISYEIAPRVPMYRDSPLGTRLIKAAKESNEVREALGHFEFTPRIREYIKAVEVLDEAETSVISALAETGSKTKAESNEPEVLSAYELFTLTLYQLPPDVPSLVVEAVRRRATRQIMVLCRVVGLKMLQRRGRRGNFMIALECARLKDDERQSYADIGRRFGWKLQYDDYRQRLNQCSTARHYVREGRKLRQLLGISTTK